MSGRRPGSDVLCRAVRAVRCSRRLKRIKLREANATPLWRNTPSPPPGQQQQHAAPQVGRGGQGHEVHMRSGAQGGARGRPSLEQQQQQHAAQQHWCWTSDARGPHEMTRVLSRGSSSGGSSSSSSCCCCTTFWPHTRRSLFLAAAAAAAAAAMCASPFGLTPVALSSPPTQEDAPLHRAGSSGHHDRGKSLGKRGRGGSGSPDRGGKGKGKGGRRGSSSSSSSEEEEQRRRRRGKEGSGSSSGSDVSSSSGGSVDEAEEELDPLQVSVLGGGRGEGHA